MEGTCPLAFPLGLFRRIRVCPWTHTQSRTRTQERHVLVCGPCRLWAVTQAHSLGTRTEWPVVQAWSHEPDSLLLCVCTTPEGVPAAHQISPSLWPHSSWETVLFNLEQVAGGEGGSGIAKAAPRASSRAAGSWPAPGCVVRLDSWCPSAGSCLRAWSDSLAGPDLAPDPPPEPVGLGGLDLFPGPRAAVLWVAA